VLEGEIVDQRFRIGARAGAGAMGVVYAARDLRTGEQVAIKALIAGDPVDLARFDREVDLLVALQHPGVVRYVAHGRTQAGEPWLAMEWLAGDTLKARFERGPLSAPEIVEIGLALASALAGAHAHGVVHRDLKPANVFLLGGAASDVRLLDFGVARLRRWRGKTAAQLTEAGAAIGTPAYMSPEQARGDDDLGAPSDVFSLGAILFELASGARPFASPGLVEMLMKLTHERAPPLAPRAPHFPAGFAALVDAMLEPASARRPAMSEVFSRLADLRREISPAAPRLMVAPIQANATMVGRAAPTVGGAAPAVAAAPIVAVADPVVAAAAPTGGGTARAIVTAPLSCAPMVLFGAVALGALFVVAVAVTIATRSEPSAKRKVASAKSARAEASAQAPPPTPPAPPSAVPPRTSQTPVTPPTPPAAFCPSEMFDRCDPSPYSAPSAVDPGEIVAACLATARKLDPRAGLLSFRAPATRGARLDLVDGAASCALVGGDGRLISISSDATLVRSLRLDTPMEIPEMGRATLPDRPCAFEKAWAVAQPLLAGEAAGLEYAFSKFPGQTGRKPSWILTSAHHRVVIDSVTCTGSTGVDPVSPPTDPAHL